MCFFNEKEKKLTDVNNEDMKIIKNFKKGMEDEKIAK